MKVYVRAPYPENRLAELREMFDEVLYEPWTETGERYYEDEMLENLLKVQPDVLITELEPRHRRLHEGGRPRALHPGPQQPGRGGDGRGPHHHAHAPRA